MSLSDLETAIATGLKAAPFVRDAMPADYPAIRGVVIAGLVPRALLATLERLAREAGAPVFAFHTASFMTSAIALYEQLGYRRAPESGFGMAARYSGFGAAPIVSTAYLRHLTPVARVRVTTSTARHAHFVSHFSEDSMTTRTRTRRVSTPAYYPGHPAALPSIDAAFKAAAQSRYAGLRALAPIHRARVLNGIPCWLVVDYELARQALTHPALLKDDTPARDVLDAYLVVQPGAGIGPNMLFADPPDHTRLRRLVTAAFTRPRVAALRPRVTEIAEELADQIAADVETDLVQSYTSLLPVRVICELLGVREREQGQFRDWTRKALSLPSPEQQQGFINLKQYLTELVAEKRRAPADDLLSALVAVRDEHDGRLSEKELVGTANLLVIAGHDTTVNLLGNAMIALFDHPEQARLLRERPELIKGAVEEFLRFDTSVEYTTMRYAARDIDLGGARITRGDIVVVSLTSANRSDPALAAAERDTLDVSRPAARHLAFGHGIHRCLGAPLAQLEAEIGIGTLLRRFPDLRPTTPTAELSWIPAGMMRGPLSLPVSITPAQDRK